MLRRPLVKGGTVILVVRLFPQFLYPPPDGIRRRIMSMTKRLAMHVVRLGHEASFDDRPTILE